MIIFSRLPLVLLALFSLVGALWGGLIRMGWNWPWGDSAFVAHHGPFMVSCFLGTVIGVERAVGSGKLWVWLGPLCSAIGAVLLFVYPQSNAAAFSLVLAGLVLVAVCVYGLRLIFAGFSVVMLGGALLWLVGNVGLWLAQPVPQIILSWMGFLLLTIAAERLELNRVLKLSGHVKRLFYSLVALFIVGVAFAWSLPDFAARLCGAACLGFGIWFLRYDVARYRIGAGGLARFIAISLILGCIWLVVTGALGLWHGALFAGFYYDAWAHAFFVGFVMSMIFAHAPIVFPAILKKELLFHPWLYSHVILLHASLLWRIGADLSQSFEGRRLAGLINAAAIVLFLLNTVVCLLIPVLRSASKKERVARLET